MTLLRMCLAFTAAVCATAAKKFEIYTQVMELTYVTNTTVLLSLSSIMKKNLVFIEITHTIKQKSTNARLSIYLIIVVINI